MSSQSAFAPHIKGHDKSWISGLANDNIWDWDADHLNVDGLTFENGDATLQKQWASLALKSLEQSAVSGSGLAQSCLSHMYLEGFGVEKDVFKAFQWCSAAAEQQYSPEITFELAEMYLCGVGVKKCRATAITLLDIAGKQGHSLALFRLSELLIKGSQLVAENEKAFKACHRSAELGLVEAQFNLGVMFEEGMGTKKNLSQAAHWYQIAADTGNKRAMNNLGNLYWHGKGLDEDRTRAEMWYSLAAENGSSLGQLNLAMTCNYKSDNEPAKLNALSLFFPSHSWGIWNAKSLIKSLFIRIPIGKTTRASHNAHHGPKP